MGALIMGKIILGDKSMKNILMVVSLCIMISACKISTPHSCEELIKFDLSKTSDITNIENLKQSLPICEQIEQEYANLTEGIKKEKPFEDLEVGFNTILEKIHNIDSSLQQKTLHKVNSVIPRLEKLKKVQGFNGYQNTRFGMSQENVKSHFEGELIGEDPQYLVYHKNGAKIVFWFFNNKLNMVEVSPNERRERLSHSDAWKDLQNTINAMTLKYGAAQQVPDMVRTMGFITFPIVYYKWTYNNKEITLSFLDNGWLTQDIRNNAAADWESLKIKYKDLALLAEEEKYKDQKTQEKALLDAKNKTEDLEGVL